MPTILAEKESLEEYLEMEIDDESFEKILFEYGLEMDGVVKEDGRIMYRIEVPANRYDLLCSEGLCQALKVFFSKCVYEPINILAGQLRVENEGGCERPWIACAVIRGIDFGNERIYRSFIEFQEKLHLTIGRNRKLASVGTHDFDKLEGQIVYKSMMPENIVFTPLNGDKEIRGDEMEEYFGQGSKIGKYLKLIESNDKYVCFEDAKGVMSVPPIINSERSKIDEKTKNVFVEVTGTDFNRVNTMLRLIIGAFRGESVESVEIVGRETTIRTPVEFNRVHKLMLEEINKGLGLNLTVEQSKECLERMMHRVRVIDEGSLEVSVDDMRSDVLHKCDLLEDVAIAYGFNNFERKFPLTHCIGREDALNKFCDKLRLEFASMGFDECLTLSLLSNKENMIERERAVAVKNPKSFGYEEVRTSLIPGLMKVIASNLHVKIPFKVFEVSDVVFMNNAWECGARNGRMLAAMYSGGRAGLEEVQGPLSLILEKCGVNKYVYCAYEDDTRYLKNQAAQVIVNGELIGTVGVCKPELCELFKIPYAISCFEVDAEKLFLMFIKRMS
ncbi:subunit beta of phenylalanyl-tRNA synthetase [Ordospora colligata]|nr:subunit beta of phenylalanyl-tRNA synthetase [Ordospora colligata]